MHTNGGATIYMQPLCMSGAVLAVSIQAGQGINPARADSNFNIHAATIFLISDVFWRDLAEIRRLKLLSKIGKNGNALKNEVEDEKMLKNMVRFRNKKMTTSAHIYIYIYAQTEHTGTTNGVL